VTNDVTKVNVVTLISLMLRISITVQDIREIITDYQQGIECPNSPTTFPFSFVFSTV